MLTLLNTAIDLDRLWQIAGRLVSIETVHDAREFADTIQQAADIVTQAGLRIAGVQSRAVLPNEQARLVHAACTQYHEAASTA